MESLRVMISGGGTGGHIFPAIAIANALRRLNKETDILFVGALRRMEMEKIPKAGYPIKGLPIAGIQRKWSWKNFLLPFKLIKSLILARSYLKAFHPNVVVGVGGYASGPLLFAASSMGIPALIQEQNSFAGITNKLLGKRVQKICVAYEGMQKFFPSEKIVITGNPVRKDISTVGLKRDEALTFFNLTGSKKILLVIGGSLGARTINECIVQHLNEFVSHDIQMIWQTGKGNFTNWIEAGKKFPAHIKVFEFIERMDLAYAAADAVISRAGALSIAELCVVKKPCVLVPSPNVAEDHQTKNAMALVNKQAALLVKDTEADKKLFDTVVQLLKDDGLQQKLKMNIAAMAIADADEIIAQEVIKLVLPKREGKNGFE